MITSPTIAAMQGSVSAVRRSLVPPPQDPHWANTVLVLGNGPVLADATGRHALVQNNGAVLVDGDGWLVFDGSSALRIDDLLEDFAFAGDFTIEGEIIGVVSGAATAILASTYNGAAGTYEVFTRGAPNLNGGFYGEGGVYVEQPAPAIVTDASVAWAFSKVGTTMRYYVGGGLVVAETSGGQDYAPDTPASLFIGRENAGSAKHFRGRMRLRVTDGVGRYTGASYVPPPWPLPTAGPG